MRRITELNSSTFLLGMNWIQIPKETNGSWIKTVKIEKYFSVVLGSVKHSAERVCAHKVREYDAPWIWDTKFQFNDVWLEQKLKRELELQSLCKFLIAPIISIERPNKLKVKGKLVYWIIEICKFFVAEPLLCSAKISVYPVDHIIIYVQSSFKRNRKINWFKTKFSTNLHKKLFGYFFYDSCFDTGNDCIFVANEIIHKNRFWLAGLLFFHSLDD